MPTLNSCRQATSERVEPLKTTAAHHEALGAQQVPGAAAEGQQAGRSAGVSLQGKTHQQVDEHRNREDTHRAQHGVGGAASASESGIDQRQTGPASGTRKMHTMQMAVPASVSATGCVCIIVPRPECSARGRRARARAPAPQSRPARTHRGARSAESSTKALSTIAKPANSRKNPAAFMDEFPMTRISAHTQVLPGRVSASPRQHRAAEPKMTTGIRASATYIAILRRPRRTALLPIVQLGTLLHAHLVEVFQVVGEVARAAVAVARIRAPGRDTAPPAAAAKARDSTRAAAPDC